MPFPSPKIIIESLVFAAIVSLCDRYLLQHESHALKFFVWALVYVVGRIYALETELPKKTKRSPKNGYYALPLPNGKKKWMHFSALCWEMLFEATGLTQAQIDEGYDSDQLEQHYGRICHAAFYALMAFDLEEGNAIDYAVSDVEEWLHVFGEVSSRDFYSAMYWQKF